MKIINLGLQIDDPLLNHYILENTMLDKSDSTSGQNKFLSSFLVSLEGAKSQNSIMTYQYFNLGHQFHLRLKG